MEVTSLLGCIVILGLLFKEVSDPSVASLVGGDTAGRPPRHAARTFAKSLGLSVRFRRRRLAGVNESVLPLAFRTTDGAWAVLVRLSADKALIQRPSEATPEVIALGELERTWNGETADVSGPNRRSGETRRFDVRWFLPEFARFKSLIGQTLAASAALQVLALVAPLSFQVVVDKVVAHGTLTTLDVMAIALVVMAVVEISLKGLREYLSSHTMTRVDARLGSSLFRHLVDLPLGYFKTRSVGVTVMRVREIDSIRRFLSSAGNTLVIDLSFSFIFLAVMFYYSATLTAVVLAAIPLLAAVAVAITPRLQRRIETLYRQAAINNSFLTEALNGCETVKALSLEPQMIRHWEEQTRDYVSANFRVQLIQQLSSKLVQFIQKTTLVAVLWIGASKVIGLELSLGQLIAFNMMASHIMEPITRLADLWREYVQARVSVDRLGDVLNTPAERAQQQPAPNARVQGHVTFANVSFRYGPETPLVLDDVSLHIPAGSMTAFVGPSGSGKSTIAKLIQKLELPAAGGIRIDGRDVRQIDPKWLRRQIGVTLQDDWLFNRTVRENIALRHPSAPMEAVVRAARTAGAHDFILGLPEGYDTMVSEGGRSLSGGERQRIAIARALLGDPPILIFDEATSALDDHSQKLVQDNLAAIRRGRTVILIAHRLSTVRDADRIHVLDGGRIVEDGSHETLLHRSGHYARLWAAQSQTGAGHPGAEHAGSPRPAPLRHRQADHRFTTHEA